jgi:hypothetical protein
MRIAWLRLAIILGVVAGTGGACICQTLPATEGETLSGRRIVLAEAVRGHAGVLLVGFSKDGGAACGDWVKAIRADPALAGVPVYEVSQLAGAPSFIRGAIKSGMRKGLSPAEQDNFVVLTQDDKLWRSYFDVTADKDPYVVLLDASGRPVWHGHGAAHDLEPLLKTALPK